MRNYVSAYHDRKSDKILIWERPIEGGPRTLISIDPPRYFYFRDDEGEHETITGERCSKYVARSQEEFDAAVNEYSRHFELYESDLQPAARALMDMYYGVKTPVVNFAFLDIETDYSSKLGFSSPENPYAPINAITIYKSWTREYITYAVPPPGFNLSKEEFEAQIQKSWAENKLNFTPRVYLCVNEVELLKYTLQELEEADILSGWNSEFFDIPYIVKRVERVLGTGMSKHLSFIGARPPQERLVMRFGTETLTYVLHGRTHIDYLDLFKKFTFEGRTSYSLANIAAEELDVPKLDYDGTLEQLYKRDFIHFVTYNARDVEVLVKLDAKFKFMQLVNEMAHENTVPFVAILGTVRYVETGIMNRAHNVHRKICTNKRSFNEENEKVEGAIVLTPLAGLHEWVGSVDITSLYPSVIRALNMSIETFFGQFVDYVEDKLQTYGERAWNGIRAGDSNIWRAETKVGVMELTGSQWMEFFKKSNFCVSAFGTIFDQTKSGMVADTLAFWFSERKRLQAEKKKYAKLAKEERDPAKKLEYEILEEHFDLLQLTKKIQLNSTYGALLNEAFRFGRREIGASVTGTGRQITLHMGQTIGHLITGEKCIIEKRYAAKAIEDEDINYSLGGLETAGNGYTYVPGYEFAVQRKAGNWEELRALPDKPTTVFTKDGEVPAGAVYFTTTGELIYGDTDSCYFKMHVKNYEDAVAVADEIARLTNETFPAFMSANFNCTEGRETLIKAAREVVAERGLFLLAKKKYTLKVVNLDGVDLREKPKLKSMGSEIKKADTPKVVQNFLKELMELLLDGAEYTKLERHVNSSRGKLIHKSEELLSLGTAKQVNNLDAKYAEWTKVEKQENGKVNLPGHVRASINFNECLKFFGDTAHKSLRAGDKAVVFYLKPNDFKFKSIAFPADLQHFPDWFIVNFSVDVKKTEQKMIDLKIAGIFEALGAEMPTAQSEYLNSVFTF